MRKIAILQSNYIPWKGVFDLINTVDCFVFHDDVQFTKGDWRTRNYIKTSGGVKLLSVPVVKGSTRKMIKDVEIYQSIDWQTKHYHQLVENYRKAKYFETYFDFIREIYLEKKWKNLSELNIFVTKNISDILGISTEFVNSVDLGIKGKKTEKIIKICKKLGGRFYLSGPKAQNYINNKQFKENNIDLAYIVYQYDEYPQLYGRFEHAVSIFDVLMNCGPRSGEYVFKGKYEVVK